MNQPTRKQTLTAYRKGFTDYLDGKVIDYTGSELEKHAYSWGITDAHYGDDMPSLDYRSDEQILKNIYNSFPKA